MSAALDKVREKVRAQIQAQNLAKQSNGNPQPLIDALAVIPVSDLWKLLQWVHFDLLPRVEKNRGKDSADYENYSALRDGITWAIYISDCYETLLRKNQDLKIQLDFYRDRLTRCETELQKLISVDAAAVSDTVDVYRRAILTNALDLITPKMQAV